MKKQVYIILIIAFTSLFYSCDLDIDPTDAVSDSIVFENASNAEKVLNGTWGYMMDNFLRTYQNPGWTSLLLVSDAMGNDVAIQPGKYGYLAHYSFTNITATNSTTAVGIWTLTYKVIDNANHVITKIDGVPGDDALKKRIKAQAYALRGYIYLNLGTFYAHAYAYDPQALCVPIYTEPTTNTTKGQARRTVEEVYKQAEDDLLKAYNALGEYSRDAKHKIDKQVAAGILARLYLQKEQWADAQRYAQEAHKGYSWMSQTDYVGGFNDRSNSEWIWGHGQTPEQSTASYSFHFKDVSSPASYYYSFMADPHFRDFFDDKDIRTQLFEWDVTRYKGGLMYKKFRFRANNTADIVLMRKAEMVLIEAEAYAEQDESVKAIAKLNELRQQRGAATPDLSGFSKEQLVEEILAERRKELFGEGFGLYDIKRRQKSVERKEATGLVPGTDIPVKGHTVLKFPKEKEYFSKNSPYYIFAIPESETTNNDNL
ncbi:MAG TPA: RagB/SusD family nutrient uptake outer membrane protein [Porphyromonadaceae bacterium]|jgi:tetratricopeptide (TPR) repeat protein|nr:RagB/SusD family nutrient uptake outer membrane protein [Porphyromonadaceae bacterium]